MKFDYKVYPRDPVPGALKGITFQPKIPLHVFGPKGKIRFDALVDTGSALTIFPRFIADQVGVTLHERNVTHTSGIGEGNVRLFHAKDIELELQIDEGMYRWSAPVWFSESDESPALLGRKGFLEFFTATFHGDEHILTLEPNKNFHGKVLNIWDQETIKP